jgi:hypothetical protein
MVGDAHAAGGDEDEEPVHLNVKYVPAAGLLEPQAPEKVQADCERQVGHVAPLEEGAVAFRSDEH